MGAMAKLVPFAGAARAGLVAPDLAPIAGTLERRTRGRYEALIKNHSSPRRWAKRYRAFIVQETGKDKQAQAKLAKAGVERDMLARLPADLCGRDSKPFGRLGGHSLPLIARICSLVVQNALHLVDTKPAKCRLDLERRLGCGQREHPFGKCLRKGLFVGHPIGSRVIEDFLPDIARTKQRMAEGP